MIAPTALPRTGLLCVAHGTVENLEEMADFLKVIRRGRPPSEELIHELVMRYTKIGGSPLNRVTARQAEALGQALGLPSLWGMRLWKPWVADVLRENLSRFDRVCVLPLAPFSVHVYQAAAAEALASVLNGSKGPELIAVEPWGSHPAYVEWFAGRIEKMLAQSSAKTRVILTAHSLPTRAIQTGDPYQAQVNACAQLISSRLGTKAVLAYQSQGADGGDWLGPDLKAALEQAPKEGQERVIVAPIGFVSEHVETLYDLDIEATKWAKDLGLVWERVSAPNDDPAFVKVLVDVVERALARSAAS
ncbi:MAG: ferrochelatase [Polyangiaceae bacterium]|nr:ferrochelatase [Polyangiaceae bacterium]